VTRAGLVRGHRRDLVARDVVASGAAGRAGVAGQPGNGGHPVPVLLRAAGLTKVFRTDGGLVRALRGVDLTLRRGEFLAVMGPSGSGKSTLLHVLGGLESATCGQIWLAGQRVDQLSQARWAVARRHHIGFVFQSFNLVSNMTAADNVELAALISGASRREARERRQELFAELGLSAKAGAAPARLSGGEQQRVALARALAPRPGLLLADEPTGNLDSANSADVLRLLRASHAQGQAILLVTHDARAASMADRVINLFDGMICDDADLPSAPAAGDCASAVLEFKG
jgi:putative ABC transport system ATP-binding protein